MKGGEGRVKIDFVMCGACARAVRQPTKTNNRKKRGKQNSTITNSTRIGGIKPLATYRGLSACGGGGGPTEEKGIHPHRTVRGECHEETQKEDKQKTEATHTHSTKKGKKN